MIIFLPSFLIISFQINQIKQTQFEAKGTLKLRTKVSMLSNCIFKRKMYAYFIYLFIYFVKHHWRWRVTVWYHIDTLIQILLVIFVIKFQKTKIWKNIQNNSIKIFQYKIFQMYKYYTREDTLIWFLILVY